MTYLGDKAESQHPKYVARIGNLTLFAGCPEHQRVEQPIRDRSRPTGDSGILLTKELASLAQFKFKTVEQRSTTLAAKAVELWPSP